MFEYFRLDDFEFRGKVVGVRVDINSPIIDSKVILNERIRKSCETISELSKRGARVVILAHQGREGKSDFVSLEEHSKLLSKELKKNVSFVNEIYSKKVEKKIFSMKDEEILLLENVRFSKHEMKYDLKADSEFKSLEKIFDFYVFDAFSVSHRDQTSVVGFNSIPKIAGRLMEKELLGLEHIEETKSPRVFIFGGAKPDDLIDLIKSGLESNHCDLVLLTGVIGEVALHINGNYLGKKLDFLQDHEYLNCVKDLKALLKKYSNKIVLPQDLAYVEASGKRVEVLVSDFKSKKDELDQYLFQDIGLKTVSYYELLLKDAQSIYVKGPAGNFEFKGAEIGSKNLMKVVTKSEAFTYMGGGHSVTCAEKFGVLDKFSYVSLAGGALVKFLSGKKLAGVESLSSNHQRFEKLYEDFIVVGSNTVDCGILVPEKLSQINLGEKIRLDEDFKTTVGGGGVNVSVCLSRLGANVAYLGKMSYETKDLVKSTLERNKIDLIDSKISKRPGAKSILVSTKDNDRVIFTYRGQNSYLELNDFDFTSFNSNNFYFNTLTGDSFVTLFKLAKKLKSDKRSEKTICFNPSMYLIKQEKGVKNLIKFVDILVLNLEEASELTGKVGVSDNLNALIGMGLRVVVITCGSQGAYACEKIEEKVSDVGLTKSGSSYLQSQVMIHKHSNKEYFQKALSSKVVDATGAGDCFAGTFFYFYSKGYGIRRSMKFASENAASVVGKKGAVDGLLYMDDLKK